MRPVRTYALTAAALAALAAAVSLGADLPPPTERPFLYRIGGTPASHLFGTIHLPDDRVLALSPAVSDALAQSDTFYSEIRLDASGQAEFVQALAEDIQGVPPLTERLSPELYARLEAFATARGVPVQVLDSQPTWLVTVMLPILSYVARPNAREPLDQKLASLARDQGKRLEGLEQPSEQVDVFSGPSEADQVKMLESALSQLEELGAEGIDPVEILIEAYLSGDETRLIEALEASNAQNDEITRALYKRLLDDRSLIMADRIAAIVRENPDTPFFFAIGAGHLPGDSGVVALLRKHGLTITRNLGDGP